MNPNGVTYTSSDTHYVYHPYQHRTPQQEPQFPGTLKGKHLPTNNNNTSNDSIPITSQSSLDSSTS